MDQFTFHADERLLNIRGRQCGEAYMDEIKRDLVAQSRSVYVLAISLALMIGLSGAREAWAVTVNPTTVTFEVVQGTTNPPSQTVTISKSNKRSTNWTAKENSAWLSVSPGLGSITSTAQVSVGVNTVGLAAGTYTGTLTIVLNKGGSASVPVTLRILPGTSSSPPPPPPTTVTTASLTWDAVTSTNLAGYKVYVGKASGMYGTPIDVGKVTSYVASNLVLGNTYYFVVTSYNGSGIESVPSAEVSKSIY